MKIQEQQIHGSRILYSLDHFSPIDYAMKKKELPQKE